MSELSAAFEGLDDSFDTKFENEKSLVEAERREIQELQDEMDSIEERKNKIKNTLQIEDSGYLNKEIKACIYSARSVLDRLDSDIKIGSSARMYEVYAALLNSITAQYKELRQLNEAIVKINMDQNKKSFSNMKADENISLTANQLLIMIKTASDNSEIKKIEAKFEIENEYIISGSDI